MLHIDVTYYPKVIVTKDDDDESWDYIDHSPLDQGGESGVHLQYNVDVREQW